MIRTSFPRKLMLLCALALSFSSAAQSPEPIVAHYGETGEKLSQLIQKEHIERYLRVLASDEMEGRETGSEGIRKAADFIASEFATFGLPRIGHDSSYFQPVAFTWTSWQEISLTANGETYRHLWDFISLPTENQSLPPIAEKSVVLLGYGIDDPVYSDYKGVDVRDKVLLVYKGEPRDKNGVSWITRDTASSAWSGNIRMKAEAAARHGARLILVIEEDIKKELDTNRRRLIGPTVTLGNAEQDQPGTKTANSILISTNIARNLIGKEFKKLVKTRDRINAKGVARQLSIPVDLEVKMSISKRSLEGNNIIGYVAGSDPQLRDEIVILTAHYDHLGKKGDDIFNGADDNGSGTSTIMEVTRVLATAHTLGIGPRRSVVTLLVTGEEKGLLGSRYYVNNPLFPLEQTIANINVDMVGRLDEKYANNPDYVYVIGSDKLSSDLHNISEEANSRYTKLALDYTYNSEDDPNRYYYRSDHYNFVEKGIPAVFYFNGTHPDYHRPSDTVEKIHFGKMEKISKLVFHVAWELANRDERIRVDVPKSAE